MNSETLNIGIVGLGLIGGSMARAYHAAGHRVLATDKNKATMTAALESGIVSAPLTEELVGTLDLLLLAVSLLGGVLGAAMPAGGVRRVRRVKRY